MSIAKSSCPLLAAYFHDIRASKGLSIPEERELSKRALAGDEAAILKLVEGNLQFVVFVAKGYRGRGQPFEDLISAGNLGLVEAARRFDGSRGFTFVTYAVWWVRLYIIRSIREESRVVRLPSNRSDDLSMYMKVQERLEQEMLRTPAAEDMVEEGGRLGSVGKIQLLQTISKELVPIDEHADRFHDPGPDAQEMLEESDDLQSLRQALETLPDREKAVIKSYYGLDGREPMTLEALGVSMGRTRERARQIRKDGLGRLRKRI